MQALQDYISSVPEDALPPLEHVDIYGPENHTTPRRLPFQQSTRMSPLTVTSRLAMTLRKPKPEDLMMEQLQLQTSLILDMQRKINKLSHRIEELEDSGSVRLRRSAIPPIPSVSSAPAVSDVSAGGQGPVHEEAPPRGPIPLRQRGVVPPESRLTRLLLLFGRLRGREVQNMEWGLIFKVVVMMAILFSRLGATNVKQIPAKFYLLGTMLIGGFLFQTGYLQFLYRFVVKENYPYRILVLDEVIPDEGPVPPRPRRPRVPHNEDEVWFDWQQTFLAGRIQRAPEEDANQLPLVFRFFREAFLLLFSFCFSVFPFWNPQAPPPPPATDAEDEAAAADGPGDVQPPVDPAGPEDDDEDIDDDGDDSGDDSEEDDGAW